VALDHYVSQVHLKKFYSDDPKGLLFAIRKRDLKCFRPDSHSVCRIEEGSTNDYLQEPRAVEEFLDTIEPRYSEALRRITLPSFDQEALYALSGFVAYVLSCSPTGMRLQSPPLKGVVEETARRLDARGEFGAPPAALGASSLTELLDQGAVNVTIDPKYPQAIGISQILSVANTLGNFAWEVLVNETDSPYFTSDFPVAIEETPDPLIIYRLVPLSPRIAVRLIPNLHVERDVDGRPDFAYKHFRRRVLRVSRPEAMAINRQIVRSAEDLVLYSRELPWVHKFVARNAAYRLETSVQRIPHGTGALLWSRIHMARGSEPHAI
jgi:hypothetical protein